MGISFDAADGIDKAVACVGMFEVIHIRRTRYEDYI